MYAFMSTWNVTSFWAAAEPDQRTNANAARAKRVAERMAC